MSMLGALIVIEGTDGSGKKTQTKILIDRLKSEGRLVATLSFPRYGQPSARKVEEYLKRKDADLVDAREASRYFAEDRLGAAEEIKSLLNKGVMVILDRYTDSNVGHQGGKIRDSKEREDFIKWLYEYEYTELGIPKPDLVIILHVPVDITIKLMGNRKTTDGHEGNVKHLKNAEEAYLWLAKEYPEVHKLVECSSDGEIIPTEQIADKVYKIVAPLLQ